VQQGQAVASRRADLVQGGSLRRLGGPPLPWEADLSTLWLSSSHGIQSDVMAASGDVLRFVDGSEFRITKAAADTNGEYLEMEWWLPPSTETPPKHIHPHQREDYEVLEGAFEVFVRDGWRTVAAGESASAPVGEVHTFRVGDRAVRVRNVHAPALDFEDYFAAESALMEAGRIRSYSSPRAVLHYAVLLEQYRNCMVMASPLLRGLITALAPLGRRLGFGRP
jgi:quercetin dioxygenase-like cupin family protein